MTTKEHAKLLGIFLWVYTGLQLLGLIVGGLLMLGMSGFMFSEFSRMPTRPGDPDPTFIIGIVSVVFVAAFAISFLLLIPEIIAAHGLRKRKSWAKVWLIIACCLAVLSVPFGTAIAIYGFWFVLGEHGRAYFDGGSESFQTPPPPQSWQ